MPKKAPANTKPSEPEQVAAYLARLKHPLAEVVTALREIILKTDASIGEEIKWNAPAFFFTGEMPPFDPKEYKRHLVVMNLAKPDSIRLVLMGGARVKDPSGLLEGDYADGRRLATFTSMAEVKAKQKALQSIVRALLQTLEK